MVFCKPQLLESSQLHRIDTVTFALQIWEADKFNSCTTHQLPVTVIPSLPALVLTETGYCWSHWHGVTEEQDHSCYVIDT